MTFTLPPKRRAEVLLVEDNEADAYVASMAFARGKLGANVNVVIDGDEAVEFLRGKGRWIGAPKPNIVLLDLNLPRRNGREVLAEMRADPALRRIPVIILSSSSADADVFDTYDLGANAYIAKPSDFEALVSIIATVEDLWLVSGQTSPR